jgi:shikimate dehydrogenase
VKRAAVLGKPIEHSRSPDVHQAGYAAAGLDDWQYDRFECDESQLADFVAGLGPEWVGLSLTMPLKEVALDVAEVVDPFAAALGAANTLVRREQGFHAYNTDAPGMVRALTDAGVGVGTIADIALLGGGGTARAAIGAATGLGAPVTVYTRRPEAVDELRPVAEALSVRLHAAPWSDVHDATRAGVVISTVPKGVADVLAHAEWPSTSVVFDVIYDPWPTPLAAAVQRAGGTVVSGLDLLLWQAMQQFELFTGVTAPVEAMRRALTGA